MQTPKKFSSFSDQVSWISDEKGIKINWATNRINKIFFMAFFFWFRTKVTQENHKKLVNTIIVDREKPKIKN